MRSSFHSAILVVGNSLRSSTLTSDYAHSPSSLSISSLLGHHLSWSALSSVRAYISLAPPLAPARQENLLRVLGEVIARKGTENTCGPLTIIASKRQLPPRPNLEPTPSLPHIPSGTLLASGISMVSFRPEPLPSPVSGTRPGETATTVHWPASRRRHQCAPSSWTNLVWQYVVGPAPASPARRSSSRRPAAALC